MNKFFPQQFVHLCVWSLCDFVPEPEVELGDDEDDDYDDDDDDDVCDDDYYDDDDDNNNDADADDALPSSSEPLLCQCVRVHRGVISCRM